MTLKEAHKILEPEQLAYTYFYFQLNLLVHPLLGGIRPLQLARATPARTRGPYLFLTICLPVAMPTSLCSLQQ